MLFVTAKLLFVVTYTDVWDLPLRPFAGVLADIVKVYVKTVPRYHVERAVLRYAADPHAELLRLAEHVQLHPRGNERVLCGVLRHEIAVCHRIRGGGNGFLITYDKRLVSALFAGERQHYERFIVYVTVKQAFFLV